jgi:hypothetical protein
MAAGKLYVQRVGETGFTERAAPHLRCLGQRPGTTRIYACTDLINDGYNLASSDDGGLTFQPVMSFRQLLGPLTCGSVQTNCQAHWERIQSVLGIGSDAGPSTDAGAGGPPQRPGGSRCSSAGDGLWTIWALLILRPRRRRTVRPLPCAAGADP